MVPRLSSTHIAEVKLINNKLFPRQGSFIFNIK